MSTNGVGLLLRYVGCAVGVALAATVPGMLTAVLGCAHLFLMPEN